MSTQLDRRTQGKLSRLRAYLIVFPIALLPIAGIPSSAAGGLLSDSQSSTSAATNNFSEFRSLFSHASEHQQFDDGSTADMKAEADVENKITQFTKVFEVGGPSVVASVDVSGGAVAAFAAASGVLIFDMALEQQSPLPPGIRTPFDLPLPYTFGARLVADAVAPAGVTNPVVGASAFIDGELGPPALQQTVVRFVLDAGIATQGQRRFPIDAPLDMKLGDVFTVSLAAMAVVSGGLEPGKYEAGALADPQFAFDQTRFDALAAADGFPTFPLDQYFTFVFSPDLQVGGTPAAVPEPSTIALLLCGVAVIAGRLGTRRAS